MKTVWDYDIGLECDRKEVCVWEICISIRVITWRVRYQAGKIFCSDGSFLLSPEPHVALLESCHYMQSLYNPVTCKK